MGTNAKRLLADVRALLIQFNISKAERYEANVIAFLDQCPKDDILEITTVSWDNEGEFDFHWKTQRLDCWFSVGLEDVRWSVWVGINNHCKDEECYMEGWGGMKIEDCDYFTYGFFDSIDWKILKIDRGQNG